MKRNSVEVLTAAREAQPFVSVKQVQYVPAIDAHDLSALALWVLALAGDAQAREALLDRIMPGRSEG